MDERYYRYYDLMFSQKDYAGEVDAILAIYRERERRNPLDVFDLGCGTGNHALAFMRRGCEVWAYDSDPAMADVAKSKGVMLYEAVAFKDLVVALFHVANYCLNLPALLALFKEARNALRDGGLFIFDTWDALLTTSDPPITLTHDHSAGAFTVSRVSTPEYWPEHELVRVTNATRVCQRDSLEVVDTFTWQYLHRLWSAPVILDCLEVAGFSERQLLPPRKWGKRSVLYVAVK